MGAPEEFHRGGRQQKSECDHEYVAALERNPRNHKRQHEYDGGKDGGDSGGICLHIRLRLKRQRSELPFASTWANGEPRADRVVTEGRHGDRQGRGLSP